jgi:hypothetical protein
LTGEIINFGPVAKKWLDESFSEESWREIAVETDDQKMIAFIQYLKDSPKPKDIVSQTLLWADSEQMNETTLSTGRKQILDTYSTYNREF